MKTFVLLSLSMSLLVASSCSKKDSEAMETNIMLDEPVVKTTDSSIATLPSPPPAKIDSSAKKKDSTATK